MISYVFLHVSRKTFTPATKSFPPGAGVFIACYWSCLEIQAEIDSQDWAILKCPER